MRLSVIILSFFIYFESIIINQVQANTKEIVIPEKDTGNIGEIRYSILTEEQFQKIYGKEWILMDGRDIREEELHTSGLWTQNNIPDTRGVFLRCKNNGRSDGKQNPGGDLAVGSYQSDEFKSHKHGGGNHNHPLWCEWDASRVWKGGPSINNTMAWSPPNHRHGHVDHSGEIIQPEGGSETRPRCITVNAFIKVRRTLNDQKTNVIMKAIENLPEQITKNPGLATIIRQLVQQEVHRAIPIAQGQGRRAPVIGGNP